MSSAIVARYLENGLRYVYSGNVHDEEGGSTYYECLIGRDWYLRSRWKLTGDGRCGVCGPPCAGLFDGPPGGCGPRRLPVCLVHAGGS